MMDEGGWDDDDNDLDFQEDDFEEDDDDAPTSNIQLGRGLLFGGLSRLMEAVTQPEEEEEDSLGLDGTHENAWEDDEEDLDALVEDEDDDGGWQQDDAVLDNVRAQELVQQPSLQGEPPSQPLLLPVNVPPTPPVPMNTPHHHHATAEATPVESSAWDDDDDDDALDGLEEEHPESGWDDTLEGLDDVDVLEQPQEQEEEALAESGWGDSLEGLDDSLEIPANPSDVLPVEPTPTESDALENTGGGGWDHDSLEGLDEEPLDDANVQEPTAAADGWDNDDDILDLNEDAAEVVVDHVPKSQAPPRTTESMMTNADESTVLRENALDDEEFETSDDYGPVVDHLPPEHGEQEHVGTRTVSTIVPESCTEMSQEAEKVVVQVMESNDVIDHVPDDVSNVQTSNDDSTASVDGDENVEGDTVDGNFGPVVDRMPSEHLLPLTPRTSGSTTNKSKVPSSFNESSLDEQSNLQEKEVDHVPGSIQDVSTKNNDDSTASVDGDEPCDVVEQDANIEIPFLEEEKEKEVDHIPDDVSNVSTDKDDSTATVDGDEPSDMPIEEKADEAEFGPVVDHMPSIQSVGGHPERTVSTIAPSSVNDELDENDGGRECGDESTSARAVVLGRQSPGVVDHVPSDASKSTNRNGTLAAATEMSVASELSNTLGDEALESDVDAREENYGPVVDHTPLQQSIHSRRNPSVRVQAPIEEIDEETDDEEQYFGPVVDHTPTVQASAVCSVTGSMAVAAPPSEVDEDSDDDSDDRSDAIAEQEGEVSDFCDDDTPDAPGGSLVSASRYGPTLVDHVPNRPGTRPTDASTLVVVDPSEVSTVGDMTYEEQQYGPVVDHLPSAHPVAPQASATGSTVVAATASVGPDDTLVDDDDVADEGRHQGDDESQSDDGATLPTLDNPPPMETNVVDHVPEQRPPDFRIDSVLTTAPTQSVLSPDETRDSEFGLVVDHLPTHLLPSPPSRGSMAVLAPESVFDADTESGIVEEEASAPAGEQPASERTMEEAKIVVDQLPPARESRSMRAADSTVTVRSHVSDDDTLEAIARPDRYGPVVDQLPASGVSVQRSLGGSTTGALATLSEVNDDTIVDEDVQGWDYDEQELDSIQDTEPGRQSRPRPGSRGLSVTFSHETVRAVQDLEGEGNNTLFASIADETQYFDAEMGNTSAKSANETHESQFFDPESGEMVDGDTGDRSLLQMNGDSRTHASRRCTSCDDAKGTECPCVQRILQSGLNKDDMVLSVTTSEGVPVEIDVKKMLQDERTRRLLLEKELDAFKSTVESLEAAVLQGEAAAMEDERAREELRQSVDVVKRELDSVSAERDAFGRQNDDLAAQLAASHNEIATRTREAEEWSTRESALLAELEEVRRAREESRSESQQLATMSDELASEVDQMRNANEELLIELDRRRIQCETLEQERKVLVDDCAAKESKLSDLVQERSSLSSRQSALEDETLQLRRALEESSQTATSETELRNQLSALQIEAATKSGECEELRAQLDQVQKKLQESEGRSFAQMKESTRVQRLHDGEVQRLQQQIQELEENKKTVVDEHEAAAVNLNSRISQISSQVQSLKTENETLKKTLGDSRNEYEAKIRQERSSSQAQASQLRALETKLKLLEADKAKASNDLTSVKSQLQNAVEQSNAAAVIQQEYDSLQETLTVNKETIQSLQEQVEVLSQANKTGTDQMETLVESISSERDDLRAILESREAELEALQSELRVNSDEKAMLEDRLEALAAKCGEMEASVEDLRSTATRYELELVEKDRLYESLKESKSHLETGAASQVREEYERQVRNLNQVVSEKDQNLQLLQSQLETQLSAIRDRDATISGLEQQRAEAEERIEAVTRDRDNTLSRFKELDAELARVKEQLQRSKESESVQSSRERKLEESLEAAIGERDAAVREREMLEEDSEELLVQLGLMKEQLDAHANEIGELQQVSAEKDIAVKHAEERLREAEGYIAELSRTEEEPQENGDHNADSGKLAELDQTVDELTLAKEDLQQQVDDLSSTNAYIDAQVTSLRDEKVELLSRLRELEQLQQTSGADAFTREQQYQTSICELEERCRHLDEVVRIKDEELGQARAQLQEAQVLSAEGQAAISSLQQQVAQLENACSEQGHVLHDRDRALEDLRLEVEGLRSQAVPLNARGQSNADIDLDSLHSRLQHAERSVQHYQERLREMEAVLEQARRELKIKTEKLSETESALFDRDLELDLQQQEEASQAELKRQLHEMEALLQQRNNEIQAAFERERSMEKTLADLRSDLLASNNVSENGPSSNAVEETRQLRAQLSSLRQHLESSSSDWSERDEQARQEVIALNETIASKKEQIASLEAQLQSLSAEFSSSQEQLVSKEADYRRLSLELEETRGDQLQSTRSVTSQLLESSCKEQAESVDNMRSHIISLAQALEKSETQRAEAIERLLSERKASADSLRRLGESVKRFYSSLSYRDA